MELNGLDAAILVVAAAGVLYGLARGALRMTTSVAALVVALYFASVNYERGASTLQRVLKVSQPMAAALSFIAVFAMVFVVVEVAGTLISRLVRTIHLGCIDRLVGGVAGGAVAVALSGVVLMLMTALLPAEAPLLRGSQLAPRVLGYTEMLLAFIPSEVKDAYAEKEGQLRQYWKQHVPPTPAPTAGSP